MPRGWINMHNLNYKFCLILLLLFSGCAALESVSDLDAAFHPQSDQVFDDTFDDVWAAVMITLDDQKIPLNRFVKSEGLILAKEQEAAQQFLNEYFGITKPFDIDIERAQCDKGRYALKVSLKKIDVQNTEVNIDAGMEGYNCNGSWGWKKLESRGEYEKELFSKIEVNLGKYKK